MRKWKGPGKGLGVLLLTAALVCGSVQPVFADGDGADSPSTEVQEKKADGEITPGGDLTGGTNTNAEAVAAEAAGENKDKKDPGNALSDGENLDAGTTDQKKTDADTPEDDASKKEATEVNAPGTKTNTMEGTEKASSELTKEVKDNDSETQLLAANNGDPVVAVDSVTWEGGLLKVPVDLGGYTADEITAVLRFAPENTDTSERWHYPTLEGDYVVYSPMQDFESCDIETFWTKEGTYNATMEFSDSEDLICTDSFTITIPYSSKLWQVEPKLVEFDGSQDLTFSFTNGTNYYALKSISHIQLFMFNGIYNNSGLENGFTYDLTAGTLSLDKDLVSAALRGAVREAQQAGLEELPTNAYVNVFAVTASGEDVMFNVKDKNNADGLTVHAPAWELDLTNFDWTAEELKIVPEATDYTYMKGDQGGATIKCTGALEDFVSVEVDGALVDHNNYTLKSGSTILTFTAKYLSTLSVGKHEVTMNYTYGSVDTNLTVRARTNPGGSSSSGSGSSSAGKPESSNPTTPVKPTEPAAPAPSNPAGATTAVSANGSNSSGNITSVQTGDNTAVMLWVLAAVFAAGTCGVLGWKRYSGKL